MHSCNRGETLTRSVQENAANRTAATRARARSCERPELFIGFAACDDRSIHASNFLQIAAFTQFKSDARSHRTPKHCVRNASAGSVLRKLWECARVSFMVELRLSRPVRLWFGTQRHD